MAVVPAFCFECHHSLSIPAFDALYPSDDFARAFSAPTLSDDSAERIERTQASLFALTDVLASLRAAVKQLEQHHERLQVHFDDEKTYTCPSPIRRLPPEVLALIFTEACQSFEREDYLTPLSISVTCFRWRNIAISTPEMWTHVFVGPVGTDDGHDGGERLSMYMDRVKGLPISLKWVTDKNQWLDEDGDVLSDDDDAFTELDGKHDRLIEEVLDTCNSWRNIEFILDEMDMFYTYTILDNLLIGYDFPFLENVSLRVNGSASQTRLPPFGRAPKLRSLALHTPELPFWTNQHIPWPQIEALTVDVWDPSNMEQCLLDYGFGEGNQKTLVVNGEFRSITSPTAQWLTRLVLQPKHLGDITLISILCSIRLPFLEELTLQAKMPPHCCGYYHTRGYTPILEGVLQLLTRSACSLRVLKIIGLGVDRLDDSHNIENKLWEELLACLVLTPSLTSLLVVENGSSKYTHLTASLVSAIISQNHLLPKLTSLGLVWSDPGLLPVDELVELLDSRAGTEEKTGGLVNLSSVVIGLARGGEVQARVLDAMKVLRARGMQATLW